jgi:hypothetical protein
MKMERWEAWVKGGKQSIFEALTAIGWICSSARLFCAKSSCLIRAADPELDAYPAKRESR